MEFFYLDMTLEHLDQMEPLVEKIDDLSLEEENKLDLLYREVPEFIEFSSDEIARIDDEKAYNSLFQKLKQAKLRYNEIRKTMFPYNVHDDSSWSFMFPNDNDTDGFNWTMD